MQVQSLVIGLAVLALVCYRQLQVRRVNEERGPLISVVLVVIGIYEIAGYSDGHRLSDATVVLLVGSLAVGVVFGALRALTIRLWRDQGGVYRQGTALTVALWVIAIAIHLGGDAIIGSISAAASAIGSVSLVLYMGLTFGVQNLLVRARARSVPLGAAAPAPRLRGSR